MKTFDYNVNLVFHETQKTKKKIKLLKNRRIFCLAELTNRENKQSISKHCLIDTGYNGTLFLSKSTAKELG